MTKVVDLESLWIGTDYSYPFQVTDGGTPAVALNITGWTLNFMVKKKLSNADSEAIITKTTDVAGGIVVSGTFNATPAQNTQVAIVTLEDTDTDSLKEGVYPYELKRMDPGFEHVINAGNIELKRSVHRS